MRHDDAGSGSPFAGALMANQKKAEWPRDRWERFSPQELRESTVGIVGYGSIGRQIARILHTFGATILATKRIRCILKIKDTSRKDQGDPAGDLVHRLIPTPSNPIHVQRNVILLSSPFR
jgi:hypothetical protein